MDVDSFRLALQRCGVAQEQARTAIVAQGYESMDVFKTLTEDEIEQFINLRSRNQAPSSQDTYVVFFAPLVQFLQQPTGDRMREA